MDLANHIRKLRPHLSDGSIKTYVSVAKNLYRKCFPDDDRIEIHKFTSHKDSILHCLNAMTPKDRKTIIATLNVITGGDVPEFVKMSKLDMEVLKADAKQHKLTDKQKENWITEDDLTKASTELFNEFKHIITKENPSPNELQTAQQYILLCLYSGKYIPTRRALDFTELKIRGDIDPKLNNQIEYTGKKQTPNRFVFRVFKTARTHGEERIGIPTELAKILIKWIKFNPYEYLIFDRNGNKLSSVSLNQRLNKLFPNKTATGVNMFRKRLITAEFGDLIKRNEELAKTMKEMGSSTDVADYYLKTDVPK